MSFSFDKMRRFDIFYFSLSLPFVRLRSLFVGIIIGKKKGNAFEKLHSCRGQQQMHHIIIRRLQRLAFLSLSIARGDTIHYTGARQAASREHRHHHR